MLLPAFGFCQKPESLVHSSTSYVDDFANVFSPDERIMLDAMIRSFYDTVQFSLVTVNSLDGMDPGEFAVRLGNHWGVGSKSNNGVLILVCPSEHKFFTATGGGVQGDLTDDLCSRYFNVYAKPRFKENDYFGGCTDILSMYINRLSPSAKEIRRAQEAAQAEESRKITANAIRFFSYFIPICILILLTVFLLNRRRLKNQERIDQWNQDKARYDSVIGQIDYIIDLAKTGSRCLDSTKLQELIKSNGIDKLTKITKMVDHSEMVDRLQKLNTFLTVATPLRRSIESHISIIESAKSITNKWSSSKILQKCSELTKLSNRLDAREVDTSDQSSLIREANLILNGLPKELNYLTGLTKTTTSQSDLRSQLTKVQNLESRLSSIFRSLESVLADDYKNANLAKTAESVAIDKIKEYERYSNSKGVSTAAATKTKGSAETFKKRVKELEGLGLAERLAWLAAFTALIVATANPAKDENLAYEADQRRLAQLEAERARRKREQEEEEDRQRRRRSSYSSSYSDSSSSSSFSSSSSSDSSSSFSSSFGGGSFDGGGGGGSW